MYKMTFDAKVKKFNDFYEKFKSTDIRGKAKCLNINYDSIDVAVDKEAVFKIASSMISSIMRGNFTSEVFCAAVAVICDDKGVSYKKYCGFALPVGIDNYEKNLKQFEEKKASGVEHPLFANHIYLEVSGTSYDLFKNVLFDKVNHLDCSEF